MIWASRDRLIKGAVSVFTLLFVIGLANVACGQTVYTWIGKNGTRHYSDVPAVPNAKVLNLTSLSVVDFRIASGKEASVANKGKSSKQAAKDGKRQSKERKKLKAYCAGLRSNIKQLVSARRVVLRKKGKITYLTGANVQHYRKHLKAIYSRYCSA